MYGLPDLDLSNIFSQGWQERWLLREVPALQYEGLAVYAVLAFSALAIYFSTMREQYKYSRASSEDKPSLGQRLNQNSKSSTKRIQKLTLIFLLHALATWFVDIGVCIYLNWTSTSSEPTTPSDPTSDDSSSLSTTNFVLLMCAIIPVAFAAGILIFILNILLLHLGPIYLLVRSLANHTRTYGRAATDALIPGARLGAAHVSLLWASFVFLLVTFLPTNTSDTLTGSLAFLATQMCVIGGTAWYEATQVMSALDEGLVDAVFCKVLMESWYVRRLFGKRTLSVAALLGEELPVVETNVDEKAEVLVQL